MTSDNLAENYLAERGISLETVKENNIEIRTSIGESRVLARDYRLRLNLDNWNRKALDKIIQESIWFPCKDEHSTTHSWIVRPFPVLTNDDGTETKFLTPKEGTNFPFIPHKTWEVKNKPNKPLLITEGPCKALAALQAGAFPIAVSGVWMATTTNQAGTTQLHQALLDNFDFGGRTVFLAYDADFETNPRVRHALIRACVLIHKSGAEVKLLTWPAEDGKGLDDYLAKDANPKEALNSLFNKAGDISRILRPCDLEFVRKELRQAELSESQLSQICKLVAPNLSVRAGALEDECFSPSSIISPDKRGRFEETIEPWPEAVVGADLLQEIVGELQRFVDVSDHDFVVISLWIVLSYLYDVFFKLPILRLKSPEKRCGKSTLIDVVELLVIKPLVTVSVTPSGLYRLIEKFHPTILIDEADSYGKDNDDLRNIVNGGYERGRPAIRTNKETLEPEIFETFGCKLLASIGSLHETIEDRSIIIDMKRKAPNVELVELCDVGPARFLELRRKIQRWALDNRKQIQATLIVRPKFLADRNWNKWRPLLTIASLAGDHWQKMCLSAATAIVREFDQERSSIPIEILTRVRTLFRERGEAFISTTDILARLNSDKEAPWADWQKGDNKGLTAEKLSRVFKPFKIKSDQPQIENVKVRGYWWKHFTPIFESYLLPEQPEDLTVSTTKTDLNPSTLL